MIIVLFLCISNINLYFKTNSSLSCQSSDLTTNQICKSLSGQCWLYDLEHLNKIKNFDYIEYIPKQYLDLCHSSLCLSIRFKHTI